MINGSVLVFSPGGRYGERYVLPTANQDDLGRLMALFADAQALEFSGDGERPLRRVGGHQQRVTAELVDPRHIREPRKPEPIEEAADGGYIEQPSADAPGELPYDAAGEEVGHE